MSVVRVFYLPQAYENMLLVRVSDQGVVKTKKYQDVYALYDGKDELIGYNINTAFESKVCGYQPMTPSLLNLVNQLLVKNGVEELVHDFTPRIVIGYIQSCELHPDSDHLHVCQVDVGDEVLQIVCGSNNVTNHIYVVVAKDQAVMPDGKLILSGKLRGVSSAGMLCSRYELGIDEEKGKGLLILDEQSVIGSPFVKAKE